MSEDRILEEARYLLNMDYEILPLNGDFKQWIGVLRSSNVTPIFKIVYELFIDDDFPYNPPKITFLEEFSHKIRQKDKIDLPIISFWRPSFHIYQVINAIAGQFETEPPQFDKDIKEKDEKQEKHSIIDTIENITQLEHKIKSLRHRLREESAELRPKSLLPNKSEPFYIKTLANFVIEHISRIEKEKGNLILLKDFFSDFRTFYNDTETDISTIISILQELSRNKLISGIKILNNQIKVLEIKPDVMSSDIYRILEIANKHEIKAVTLFMIMQETNWDHYRCRETLENMTKLGLSRYINDITEGEKWYFPSLY